MIFDVAGVRIKTMLEPDPEVRTLGVQIELTPGVAADVSAGVQSMFLEAIAREWQREIGAVTRGGAPQRLFEPGGWWLPGWTMTVFGEGTVLSLQVEAKEEYGDPAVRGDGVSAGRD